MLNVGRLVAFLGLDTSEFDDGLGDSEGAFDSFGGRLASIAGGLAIGAIITDGITTAFDQAASGDLLSARLGLSEAEADLAGRAAGDVYAGAWGDSLDEVNLAVQGVATNLVDLGTIGEDELETVTSQALDLAKVLDEDVGRVTQVAGDLVRNGLAKDWDEAFDIMTTGMQDGLNRSGDFLDVLNEYAEPIASLGLDGPEALALFGAALDEGAFNLDKVGDAMKELSIRAVDGSDASTEALAAIGLEADEIGVALLAGGDQAQDAFSGIVQGLLAMEDPLAQDAAAVALFGTTWEDLGPQVIAALDPATLAVVDVTDATERMSDTLNSNARTALTAFQRAMKQKLVDSINKAITVVGAITGFIDDNRMAFIVAAGIITAMFIPALVGLAAAMVPVVVQALILAAPFIAIGAAILGVGFAVQWLIENWGEVTDLIVGFLGAVADLPGEILDAIGNLGRLLIDAGKDLIAGLRSGVTSAWNRLASWLQGLPDLIVRKLGSLARTLLSAGKALLRGLWDGTKLVWVGLRLWYVELPTRIVGAIGDLARKLLPAGRALLRGLWDGAKAVWDLARLWYVELPARILRSVGNLGNLLKSAGSTMIREMWLAASAMWGRAVEWFRGLKDKVLAAVGTMANLLKATGRAVIDGLWQGAVDVWDLLKLWFGGLKDKVVNAVTFVVGTGIDWIKWIGKNIIIGFWQGISEIWGQFIDWLWAKIRALPGILLDFFGIGSPSRLFREIGEDTMAGFWLGMETELEAGMARFAGSLRVIPAGTVVRAAAGVAAAGVAAGSVRPPGMPMTAAASGLSQHFTITGVGTMSEWQRERRRAEILAKIRTRVGR